MGALVLAERAMFVVRVVGELLASLGNLFLEGCLWARARSPAFLLLSGRAGQISLACSRKRNFWIFPVDVLGIGMKTNLPGTL